MRELNDWLTEYLKYTDNSESPLTYHTWCGLSVIAGALQRKVYIKWGLGQVIYPNMYVILIGPSGRVRKGVALGIAKDFIKQVPGVSVAPESSSGRQAMILAMKRALASFQDPKTKRIQFHCAITAFSEELSVFLGQGDIAYLSNLTDWFDSKDDWEYETVGRGKDSLQGLCLNLIGGTAPDWIQSMLPPEAVGGGFTSRCIFVVEEHKRKTVPKYIMSDADKVLKEKLGRDLERISKLAGEVVFSDEAEAAYVDWYTETDAKLAKGEQAVDDTRFAGYCERRATHVRKLSIICSASRSDSLIINIEDFNRALRLLETVEVKMHKTFGGLGRSKNSTTLDMVKSYIQGVGVTTRKTLMMRFYRDLTPAELGEIEMTLHQMGVLEIKLIPGNNDKLYTWKKV